VSVIRAIAGQPGIESLDLPNQEAIAIDGLTLEHYHEICYWNLRRYRNLYCSTSAAVNLNTIIACPSGDRLKDLVEIALLPDGEVSQGDWGTPEGATGKVMEGGWTRYYDLILAA
jgi:hypothetical protein